MFIKQILINNSAMQLSVHILITFYWWDSFATSLRNTLRDFYSISC